MSKRREISLVQDLETSYFAYAVEVITDRALPRIEDGLLPVQRRILYAMHAMGLRHTSAYKKSARVVGEVLGKFHPHGDSSVYGSMVRLAQEFSMGAPLVDGQGNFGSVDGDSPAAMRYTEARLAAIAQALLQDLDRDTVDWVDNFDGSLQEPVILPAALPNLLVNGASGIAVGMSTNMPPHNLAEVCDALVYVANHWAGRDKITIDRLMAFIPGPDFPTGGIAYRYRSDNGSETVDTIRDAYLTGRGKIVTQARLTVKEIGGGKAHIIVTELPYAVQKSTVLDKIAREVGTGRIEGVSDLRDESDYEGMRVVIEVMRGYDPRQTLDQLLTYTQLRETFGVISRVLVVDEDGEVRPEMLSLAQMLIYFIDHRLNVIIRRSNHELIEREARLHIIEGLLKALDMVDEVVAAIRKSRSKESARKKLQKKPFAFSQIQANAIVAMPLGNLASLEIKSLKKEGREVGDRINYLQELLASETKRLAVVVEETEALRAFAVPRRTVILDDEEQAAGSAAIATEADLRRPDKRQVAIISTAGFKRFDAPYRYRVTDGVTSRAVETNLAQLDAVDPDGDILLLSSAGRAWQGKIWRLPETATAGELGLKEGERLLDLHHPGDMLILGTRRGKVKRIEPEPAEANWSQIIGLAKKEDELLFAGPGPEAIFVTAERVIRFNAGEQVNPQATPSARGVIGIKVKKKDRVVTGAAFDPARLSHLVTISENGFVRRIPLAEIPLQGRGGQGVVLGVTNTTGPIIAATVVPPAGSLDIVSVKGRRHRLDMAELPELSRNHRGEPLLGFDAGELPALVVCLDR